MSTGGFRQCRWCEQTGTSQGVSSHERHCHRAAYWAAGPAPQRRRRNQPAPEHRAPPPETTTPPRVAKYTNTRKHRAPDPELDALLARIDSQMADPTGRELLARWEARTPKDQERIRFEYPLFGDGAYGHFKYRIQRGA